VTEAFAVLFAVVDKLLDALRLLISFNDVEIWSFQMVLCFFCLYFGYLSWSLIFEAPHLLVD